MSVALDRGDAEQQEATDAAATQPGMASDGTASVTPASEGGTITVDRINNWTGYDTLPFVPMAERVLEIEAHDEAGVHRGELVVSFGKPTLLEGKGWACVFRMSAMGRVHVSPARGVDAVDALQQAFSTVHRQLEGMRRMHRITFAESDDLGFGQAAPSALKGQGCPVMSGSLGG